VSPNLDVYFKADPEIRLVEAPEATFFMPKLRHLSNQLLVSIKLLTFMRKLIMKSFVKKLQESGSMDLHSIEFGVLQSDA
jgi:hypothetical protein